ncbi:MAG: hypothetical protein ACRDHY_14035 [Anaerolineales bacterium]
MPEKAIRKSWPHASQEATGAGLVGALVLVPDLVHAGDPSQAFYTVANEGNATVTDLGLRVVLVDPRQRPGGRRAVRQRDRPRRGRA